MADNGPFRGDIKEMLALVWQQRLAMQRPGAIYRLYTTRGLEPPEIDEAEAFRLFLPVLKRLVARAEGESASGSKLLSCVQGYPAHVAIYDVETVIVDPQPHGDWPRTGAVVEAIEQGKVLMPDLLARSFFHFADFSRRETRAPERATRLYVGLAEPYHASCEQVMGVLVDLLRAGRHRGYWAVKVAGPYRRGRLDHIVAYFTAPLGRDAVLRELQQRLGASRGGNPLASALPFCVARRADGIGVADEPPGNTSFGAYIADAIREALRRCEEAALAEDADPPDLARFEACVAGVFASRRINPEQPAMEVGRFEPAARRRGLDRRGLRAPLAAATRTGRPQRSAPPTDI